MTRRQLSRVPWRRTVAVGLVFGAVFAFVYVAAVRTAVGQQLDDLSLGVGGLYAEGPIGRAAGFWRSDLPALLAVFAVALGVVGIWRRRWRRCVAAGLLAVLTLGVGQVVKRLLPRPDLGAYGYPWNTLPSGHTIVASSVVLGVLLMLPTRFRRGPVVLVALALMVATGYASVLTQAHLTSDVLCGLLLVGGGAVVIRPLADRSAVPPAGRLIWPLVPLAGLGAAACWQLAPDTTTGLQLIAVAQVLAVTAVAALVLALLAHLAPVGPGPGPDTGYGDDPSDGLEHPVGGRTPSVEGVRAG